MKVVLPFKDRPNYLRITIATLIESLRYEASVEVILFNDVSSVQPDIINDNLDKLQIINRDKPLGSFLSKAGAIQHVFDNYPDEEYVLCLDSDCVIHPDAYTATKNMISDLPDMGIGTIFNSSRHDTVVDGDQYIEKKDIGGLGAIVKREVWDWCNNMTEKHGRKHPGWDWNMCIWITESKKWKIYSTKRSYIEHIGQTGSHSGPACIIDRANRFTES